jgi:hypothetical protein
VTTIPEIKRPKRILQVPVSEAWMINDVSRFEQIPSVVEGIEDHHARGATELTAFEWVRMQGWNSEASRWFVDEVYNNGPFEFADPFKRVKRAKIVRGLLPLGCFLIAGALSILFWPFFFMYPPGYVPGFMLWAAWKGKPKSYGWWALCFPLGAFVLALSHDETRLSDHYIWAMKWLKKAGANVATGG